MTDKLSGIFDNLNPDDFTDSSSALFEHPLHNPSTSDFERFVSEQLRRVRFGFAAADGSVNPIAVLANTATVRVFGPQDDERVKDYAKRLATESRAMKAHWLFVATKTTVGTLLPALAGLDDAHDVDDKTALAAAESMGTTQEAIYWYAERRDHGKQRQHGYLPILASDKLGDSIDGEVAQPVKAWGSILG